MSIEYNEDNLVEQAVSDIFEELGWDVKKAYKDDVLFTVRAPVGELNVADQDCCIGRGLAAIQAKDKNENKFLYYVLKAHKGLFLSRSSGAVYDAINGIDLTIAVLLTN